MPLFNVYPSFQLATLNDHISIYLCLFSSLDIALKKAGIWLCGECFHTHSFSKNCRHANGSVTLSPSLGDVSIHCIPRPLVSTCVPCVGAEPSPPLGFGISGFNVDLLGQVFLKPFRTVKSIPSKLRLGFARVFLQALDVVLACPRDVSAWVQLLILPCCVLGTFLPKTRSERRSSMRERCQFDSISKAVSRW